MKRKPYDKSVYRSFALVIQFGINMLVPICMMTALGIFLDGKFGTGFWTILLFAVGALAGGQNTYRMARQIYDATGKTGQADPAGRKGKEERSGIDDTTVEKE